MTADAATSANSWRWRSWASLAGALVLAFVLGFVVMGRGTAGSRVGLWASICRSIGLTPDATLSRSAQPVAVVPSYIAWTPATLATIASGNADRGAFVALNCTVCHGERGRSTTPGVPTLAGMDAAALYKQLADYRSGKRDWGVMNGIALALSAQGLADVAAYYAGQRGLPHLTGRSNPFAGGEWRSSDSALRLVFAGDPSRGIAPCGSCHGPNGYKLGAPALALQDSAYLVRETAAFAQGSRRNDINEQMRTIAAGLTGTEREALALYYARGGLQASDEGSGRR